MDAMNMVPLAEVPITLTSDLGYPITTNPIDVDVVDGNLRFYFFPDQHNSTLDVFEAVEDSQDEF